MPQVVKAIDSVCTYLCVSAVHRLGFMQILLIAPLLIHVFNIQTILSPTCKTFVAL